MSKKIKESIQMVTNKGDAYAKKITVIIMADQQGEHFNYVLETVKNQTLSNKKYEIIILYTKDTNVDLSDNNMKNNNFFKGIKAYKIEGSCLGYITDFIASKKKNIAGEYITILRENNTLDENALLNMSKMNGDILVMDFLHPSEKVKNQTEFEEIFLKKCKVFIGRKSGLHKAHEMTTNNTTELGKAFHLDLFNNWKQIPKGDDGTSLVFYSMLLSKTNGVFYYPKPFGILRNNIGWNRMGKNEIVHYQNGLIFLSENITNSLFLNKLILMRLYGLMKMNDDKVPLHVFDINFDKIIHDEYAGSWSWCSRRRKKKRDKKGIEVIKNYLADRINDTSKSSM